MECREVRPLVDAFVSEQLLVETTQAIVAHLDRCPACRVEIDGLRRLRLALRSAFGATPTLEVRPGFVAAVTARLRTEAGEQQGTRIGRGGWLTLAASLLLLIGFGVGVWQWSAASTLALLRDAVGDHRFCALTFKLAEAPIPLEEAARRYGGANRLLATVEPSRAVLSGGPLRIVERHSCVFGGRRFAHIVLAYKDEAVSLLVADDLRFGGGLAGARALTPAELPETDSFHVTSFRQARHVVFLVSSLSREDVHEVADAMVDPVSRALNGA